MKRADLKVGAELFYARRWEWQANQGYRATVLAVEPYERNRSVRRSEKLFRPATKGQGVHVRIHTDDPYNPDRDDVVPLSTLRGPWAEVSAEITERRKTADEDLQKHRAERESKVARRNEMIRELAVLGVEARKPYLPYEDLILTIDQVETLVTMLRERGLG